MNATDALPPSSARIAGASRDGRQKEPKAGAPADAVALFAEMVSRAAERLDGGQASSNGTRADEDRSTRSPSPDEANPVAGTAPLPAAREASDAGRDALAGGRPPAQAAGERDASGPPGTTGPIDATGGSDGAATEATRHGRATASPASRTLAPEAGQLPHDSEAATRAWQGARAGALDAASDTGVLAPGRELPGAGPAAAAAGPRDAGHAAKPRVAAGAEPGSTARHALEAAAAAATRAAAGPAASDAATAATPAGAAARAAASFAAGNSAAAPERGRPAARRGPQDAAAAPARGGPPMIGRHGNRWTETADPASTRAAGAAAQGAATDGAAAGATSASSPPQLPAGLQAGSFGSAMDAAGAARETPLAADPAIPQLGIDIPVQDEAFAEAFARQATHLVVQGGNRAEIHLTPRELGPVRIAIEVDLDAASLEIAADRHETRAAIEASMPTLRQMLAEQGVRLSDWRVAGDAADRRQAATGDNGAASGGHAGHAGNGGGGATHGGDRPVPGPTSVAGGDPQGGGASRDRSGLGASPAQVASRPDASRGGNRLDLFA